MRLAVNEFYMLLTDEAGEDLPEIPMQTRTHTGAYRFLDSEIYM